MNKFLVITLVLFSSSSFLHAAEDIPNGSYSEREVGFYLDHFDRSPDPVDSIVKFNGNLFRGGQPDFNDGNAWLRKLQENSIELVIDIRHEAASLIEERNALQAAGISYILLPWHTDGNDQPTNLTVVERIFENGNFFQNEESLPRVEASLKVLEIANNYLDQGRRIYIHCQRGEDRTGTFISLLRDPNDNWSLEYRRYGGSTYRALSKHRADIAHALEQL